MSRTTSPWNEPEHELEAVRKAALCDQLVASQYIEDLRERLQRAEATTLVHAELAALVENIINDMQSEAAALSCLTDTVQSSRFWIVKGWLSRVISPWRR